MAEQQLVDYIKKARDAGQTDVQTKILLIKNGWTDTEISDALASLVTQPASKIVAQPTVEAQPEAVISQPEAEIQPQISEPIVEEQPQIQPQYKPQPAELAQQNDMPMVRKSHLFSKLLIVLIILVVLGGIGYYVAGQYLTLPWNPFAPNPATVIGKMMTNMKSVKSSHVVTSEEVDVANSAKVSQGKISLTVNGDSDITDVANPKLNFTISANLTSSSPVISSASANASIVGLGKTFYFALNKFAFSGAYSVPDISKYTGNWYKFDQDSVTALSQAAAGQLPINVSQSTNSVLTKQVQDLISAENLISFDKKLNDEVVSGQDTYHYSVIISKTKLEDLFSKIMALEIKEASASQPAGSTAVSSSPLVLNMAQAFTNTFFDAIGDINMEMWIGKKDYLLYETKIDKTIDLSKAFPGADAIIEAKFDSTSSNFNKSITVTAPEGAQKIEDALSPLLKSQKIKSDLSQVNSIATNVFSGNSSYSSLCSRNLFNGYLATYGQTLVDLNNDIISQGGKKPACFASIHNYCISTQLADGSYLCIDYTGATGTANCTSAKSVCNSQYNSPSITVNNK